MVNDRFNSCKISSAFTRCSRKKSINIKDKRKLNSKIHLVVNEYDTPINLIVTSGSRAGYKEAIHLIKNISTKLVFTDLAYDTNEILSNLNQRNMKPVTSPKRNRLHRRGYKGFKEKRQ